MKKSKRRKTTVEEFGKEVNNLMVNAGDYPYDEEGNATHYDTDRLNTIVKMERIWGTIALMYHCEITAFKYRERIGKKPGQDINLEIKKANWYERAANYYWSKIKDGEFIHGTGLDKMGLPWEEI